MQLCSHQCCLQHRPTSTERRPALPAFPLLGKLARTLSPLFSTWIFPDFLFIYLFIAFSILQTAGPLPNLGRSGWFRKEGATQGLCCQTHQNHQCRWDKSRSENIPHLCVHTRPCFHFSLRKENGQGGWTLAVSLAKETTCGCTSRWLRAAPNP